MTSSGGVSATYNGDGTLVQRGATRYTQDLTAGLSQVLHDGSATYVYGHERLAAQQGATRTWYVGDALGSVRATLDGAGAVQGTLGYDPWGTPQGDLLGTFGFTGALQDGASGLVHVRARWYDPGQSTFTSRDPFAGCSKTPYSLHPYQYAYANPVLHVDPSGECVITLYYRPAVEGMITFYHIDVVVNDCDGPGHDKKRLCDRDPLTTMTMFWGGPEIADSSFEQIYGEDADEARLKGILDRSHPWGQVVADSGTFLEQARRDPRGQGLNESEIRELAEATKREFTFERPHLHVLWNSEPCDRYLRAMEHFKIEVMNAKIPYHPTRRNSNGVAYGYLAAAGLRHPEIWQHAANLVVGYNDTIYRTIHPQPQLPSWPLLCDPKLCCPEETIT